MAIDPRTIYALILGGGAGSRLYPLTKDRAKPAVPFAGKYRLIDVPISNCLHSGLAHIFVLTQYNSQSLHRHIQQTYRLDFTSHGFVDILAAEQNRRNSAWYQGTADAVRRNLWHLNNADFTHVLILSGDQLYRMNFQDIFATHERLGAEVTLAITPKLPEEAGAYGIVKIAADFRVLDFVEKPTPAQLAGLIVPGEDLAPLGVKVRGPVVLASMGIYAFSNANLRRALANDMEDFGKHVIPWCVQHMKVCVHPFVGYWEDIGTIRNYFQANLAMTSWRPPFEFYEELRPIFTHPRLLPNSKLDDVQLISSTLSEGCFIRQASIVHSVIGVRSAVRRGSILTDVVMLGQDTYGRSSPQQTMTPATTVVAEERITELPSRGVGRNCRITRAIIDKNVCIGDEVVITDHSGMPDEEETHYVVRDGIVIIPKNAVIPAGTRI